MPDRAPPKPIATYVIIALNVAMFGYELARGLSPLQPTGQQLVEVGGNFAPLTLGGEPWRLVTSMFLHAGVLHIALNMWCLYSARIVEQVFGRLAFVAIYSAAGLGGAIATVAVGANRVSVGASGAVFGVVSAFGVYLAVNRHRLDAAAVRTSARSLGRFFAINLVIGFAVPGIDMSAHLGGLVVGAVAAFAIAVHRAPGSGARGRSLLVMIATIAASLIALIVLPAPQDMAAPREHFEDTVPGLYNQYLVQARKLGRGEITQADLADDIDRDVLPAWQTLETEIAAIRQPTEPLAADAAYLRTTRLAFEKLSTALRHDDGKAATEAIGALDAETAALNELRK